MQNLAPIAFVAEDGDVRVNFGIFAGRDATQAEVDELARTLLERVKSVTVVDDSTVRFATERPWPLLPRYLGYYGMIVPPKLTESSEDALVRHPVGTGAYKFVRWVKDDRVELEANPDYWAGKPRIGRVTFRAIPNESARLAELLAGSVHLINTVPPELFKPIQDSPKAKLV